jgi:hypothetical protein
LRFLHGSVDPFEKCARGRRQRTMTSAGCSNASAQIARNAPIAVRRHARLTHLSPPPPASGDAPTTADLMLFARAGVPRSATRLCRRTFSC